MMGNTRDRHVVSCVSTTTRLPDRRFAAHSRDLLSRRAKAPFTRLLDGLSVQSPADSGFCVPRVETMATNWVMPDRGTVPD